MKITYLYAKQHNVTGLRYFGKTQHNPYKYKGSGTYWVSHCRKHGWDVTTTWVQAYTDNQLLNEEALFFSTVYDIVKSKEWANLRPENGLDRVVAGGPGPKSKFQQGHKPWNTGKKIPGHGGVKKGNTPWNKGKEMKPWAPVSCIKCHYETDVCHLTQHLKGNRCLSP